MPKRLNLRPTYRTDKNKIHAFSFDLIEDRFSPILVTVSTYPMRWFGIAHGLFKCIYNGPFPRGVQLVSLLLSFPCFYASDFFFQCAYFLNHRRLGRIGRKCATLGGQNGALKLNDLSLNFRDRFKVIEALRNVTSELKAGNRALNQSHVHSVWFLLLIANSKLTCQCQPRRHQQGVQP